jgi:hypothetical protein
MHLHSQVAEAVSVIVVGPAGGVIVTEPDTPQLDPPNEPLTTIFPIDATA